MEPTPEPPKAQKTSLHSICSKVNNLQQVNRAPIVSGVLWTGWRWGGEGQPGLETTHPAPAPFVPPWDTSYSLSQTPSLLYQFQKVRTGFPCM